MCGEIDEKRAHIFHLWEEAFSLNGENISDFSFRETPTITSRYEAVGN